MLQFNVSVEIVICLVKEGELFYEGGIVVDA